MTYSLKHLQYLVAVTEEKSFSKAASRCFVTQSTLSLGIQELERQMDTKLFERGRKNIIPTAAGQLAFDHAKAILKQNDSLATAMQTLGKADSGPLRIGAIPTIAPYFLPKALDHLASYFPKSDFRISEDTTETIINKITEGEMDLGILAFPVSIADLDHHILFSEDFVVAAPMDMAFERPLTLKHLNDYQLLLLRDGHCLKDHILKTCNLPPHQQNRFFEAESLHTLLAMVNQGYGLTLLPEMAVTSNLPQLFPNIKLARFDEAPPARHIGLVWRKTDIRQNTFRKIAI